MRVLALSGGVRAGSYNTELLRAAAAAAPAGTHVELHPSLALLPGYDEDADTEAAPLAVHALRRAIDAADALLIATPEYNGSVPGQLKHAIDWASRPYGESSLWGKPVAVIGASTGSFGGIWAQQELRRILKVAGARVLDDATLAVANASDEAIGSPSVRAKLVRLLQALAGSLETQPEAAMPHAAA
jgi:chromate reductase